MSAKKDIKMANDNCEALVSLYEKLEIQYGPAMAQYIMDQMPGDVRLAA